MSVTKEAMGELSAMINNSQDGHVPPEGDDGAAAAAAAAGTGDETPDEEAARLAEEAAAQLAGDDETAEEEEARLAEEAAAAAADEGESDGESYSPKQLAEAIDWDTKDLYEGLVIPLDDGQEALPLGELKNNYQNLTRENATMKTQLEEQGGQLQQAQSGFSQNQQVSAEMLQAHSYLESINRMEQSTNWKELEELDAADAVLKRQKFQQARADVQGQIQLLTQQQEQAKAVYLQQAAVKMVEIIPGWSDAKAKQADQDVIRAHMQTAGFVDQEINQIADPRVMGLLKELIDLRSKVAAAGEAVKKVRKAPKVIRGRGAKQVKKGEATQQRVTKARQTGGKNDALNAVKSLIKDKYGKK